MAGGLIRQGGRRGYQPMAEINVTPMVDVMLVLLIVFMVTAPLLTVGVPVDLPKSDAPAIHDDKEPLVVSIKKDGSLFLQDTALETEALVPKLTAISDNNKDAVIFLRGDQSVDYGRVNQILALIASAGFTKVSLVAESPQGNKKP